ncbi:hypothetical protein FGIG_08664 [Fasciola gigantica]|uniref:Uncharacterized protein n=1 Tax=Fasciola gigantica TaxID=46835 RepID=A0A504YL54_FASGI|nr:hypothetical protein FGIG_08664 [Fasciola gigantica]
MVHLFDFDLQDPREAEERRYLIRQNKKLLNQDRPDDNVHLVAQLREQLNNMKTDLVNQKAESAAMQARQLHLENLVRDLRRDNVDLRDQLAKLDDAENSLAESDKPLAAGTRMLQIQLEQQNERVRELQLKLNASREYTEHLEARIAQFEQSSSSSPHNSAFLPVMPTPNPVADQVSSFISPSDENPNDNTMPAMSQLLIQTFRLTTCFVSLNGMGALDLQAKMLEAMERELPGFRAPRVDDKLLQDTIRTFKALLHERDQELAQLKQHIRQHADEPGMHGKCKVILPQLFETSVQTELTMEQAQKLTSVTNTLLEGGLLLTYDQSHALMNEIYQCVDAMDANQTPETGRPKDDQALGFTDLLSATNRLRARVRQMPSPHVLTNGEMADSVTKVNSKTVNRSPFLYTNYQYWRGTVEGQSSRATSRRDEREKRRWLEDALLCLTLTGMSAALSEAVPVSVHGLQPGVASNNLTEAIKVLVTHWKSQSPSWLVEKLRLALIELPRPSPYWYVSVIDFPRVPRNVLSRIFERLCSLSLSHRVPGHDPNTVRSTDTGRLHVNHFHGILLLRMRLTAYIIYPSKSTGQVTDLGCLRQAVEEICPHCLQYNPNELFVITNLGPYAPLIADLHLFLHGKYRLWEMELEPFMSNCPDHLIHTLFTALNPIVVDRLELLANHERKYRLFLLGRILYVVHFEPNALTAITDDIRQHEIYCRSYNLAPDLRFENCSRVAQYTLCTHSSIVVYLTYCLGELSFAICLLTGLCPEPVNSPAYSNDRPTQLWMNALHWKELISQLLFESEPDKHLDTQRIRQTLSILAVQDPAVEPTSKLWLPEHKCYASTDPIVFVLSCMFVSKSVDVIKKYSVASRKANSSAALRFARTLEIPLPNSTTQCPSLRWLLRQMELCRDLIYGTRNVSGKLMQIWCQTTVDWNRDAHSLRATGRTFLANIRSRSTTLAQGQPEGLIAEKHQNGECDMPEDNNGVPEKSVDKRMTTSMIDSVPGRKPHSPEHYNGQLDELRQTTDLESVRAHLGVSERRRQELERRLMETTEELSRARAEARSADTSLAAARRTEAALRRRLLVAMDMQGSGTDPNSVRHSYSGTLSAGTEARDALELQAALIKAEATNAALTEAAQLDRNRLHEQAMRIGQFEAEHRALLDRISILQTTEANAQRGIVRLQALYEDMLREYSESRSQELNWRSRERSRSNYRQQQNETKGSKQQAMSRTDSNLTKLQRQVHDLEAENRVLKQTINSQSASINAVVSHPVGPCTSPACLEVRQLLRSFQERFSEAVGQAEQCLDSSHLEDGKEKTVKVKNALVISLRTKLGGLQQLLRQAESGLDPITFVTEIDTCNQLFARLEGWLHNYMHRTDSELSELRSRLIGFQIASVSSEPTFVTSCSDRENGHPFSCSISLNKKPHTDLLAQREKELMKLRMQLREVESELELRKAQVHDLQASSNRTD